MSVASFKLDMSPVICTKPRKSPRGGATLLSPLAPRSDTSAVEEHNRVAAAATATLKADSQARREMGSLPAKWFWFGRAAAVVLLSAAFQVVSALISVGHEVEHEHELEQESLQHAEAPDHEEHVSLIARHGISKDGNIWKIQWMLLMVLSLMGATVLFEMFKELLERTFHHYEMVLHHMWSELTVLGFLSLCTFVMIKGEILQAISLVAFNHPHYLVEMFESLHFMLFFVLIGFLFIVIWLLIALAQVNKQQRAFEDALSFYRNVAGTGGLTLANALGLKGKSKVDPDVVEMELATGAAIVESELEAAEEVVDHRSWIGRMRALMDPCDSVGWELRYAQKLVEYQRLRHRFIMAPANFGRDSLPASFDFSNYSLHCVQDQLSDIIQLGPTVWLRGMLLAFVLCEGGAIATELQEMTGYTSIGQALLILAGWALYAQACLVEQHYRWVSEQLVPVKSAASAKQELERLRHNRLLWRRIYDWLHPCLYTNEGEKEPDDDNAVLHAKWEPPKWVPGGVGTLLKGGQSALRSARDKLPNGGKIDLIAKAGKIDLVDMLNPEKQVPTYEPGEFMRRSASSLGLGESKHTSLFFLKSQIQRLEQVDLYQMKLSAQRPAQLWVQQMLLMSSLLITINCVFFTPDHVLDWKIPLGIFPVLLTILFAVPETLEPMITALSVEMLTDVKGVQHVLYESKLKRFAHAAKLLQALRSEATHQRRTGAVKTGKKPQKRPETLKDLVQVLPPSKRSRLVHLKETFDLFNTDEDQTLQPSELCSLLFSTGTKVTKEEVDRMVRDMDTDGDGSVSFVEFAWYMISREEVPVRDAAEAVFETVDTDGSGVLSISELRTAFKNLKSGLDDEELMDIISIFDVGSTGRVERSEFVEKLVEIFNEEQ